MFEWFLVVILYGQDIGIILPEPLTLEECELRKESVILEAIAKGDLKTKAYCSAKEKKEQA